MRPENAENTDPTQNQYSARSDHYNAKKESKQLKAKAPPIQEQNEEKSEKASVKSRFGIGNIFNKKRKAEPTPAEKGKMKKDRISPRSNH